MFLDQLTLFEGLRLYNPKCLHVFNFFFRLRVTKMLLVGLGGLGAEVCKNIVLAGIKSITLMDDQIVTEADFFSQFLITREDVGKNVRNFFICIEIMIIVYPN